MNGLEKIVARMEADTRAECDALTASAAENAADGLLFLFPRLQDI